MEEKYKENFNENEDDFTNTNNFNNYEEDEYKNLGFINNNKRHIKISKDENLEKNFYFEKKISVMINLLIKNHMEEINKKKGEIKEKIFSINLTISENLTIKELINFSVDKFNEKFKLENLGFSFLLNYDNFEIKAGKKNGKPNEDIPSNF